jgi:rare lipoprotein A
MLNAGESKVRKWQVPLIAGVLGCVSIGAFAGAPAPDSPQAKQEAAHLDQLPPVTPRGSGIHQDSSGRKQRGNASYYSSRFTNRKMADGRKMNPNSNVAASKTLPLGTVAKVTNLDNGKSAMVKVQDRGPFVPNRVVDLAPKVANELDLKKQGVAPVEIKPVTIPQPDGGVKLGAGAADSSPQEVKQAADVTRQLVGPKATETAER